MEKIVWIKELVKAEQQMEESGMVDMTYGYDQDRLLAQETLQFLLELKADFVDASSAFNELKPSPLGRVKVYGIAKTHADFMLFRNGFKMIFTLKAPGQIGVRFNFIGTNFIPGPSSGAGMGDNVNAGTHVMEEQIVEARWGAFGEILWTFQGNSVKRDYMVRHYMSMFLRESSK